MSATPPRQSALTNPHYRSYFIASIFGTMAVWLMRFVFSWLIWQLTESFFWVGVGSAGLLIPSLIITPIAGVMADRINLKQGYVIWLAVQSGLGLLTLCILSFWQLHLWLVLALIFCLGIVQAAGSPLRLTLIPKLVSQQQLANAVGLGAIVFNSSRILAPALAAWLLTLLSAELMFGLSTLCFVIAGVFVRALPSVDGAGRVAGSSGWQEFKQGLGYALHMPFIRLLFALTLLNAQVARAIMELLPAIAGTYGNGTPADLATLTAFAGIGSIMGGVLVSRHSGHSERLVKLLVVAMLMTAFALVPLYFDVPLLVIAGLISLISMMMTLMGTSSQILLQLNCDERKRGRVMSLWLTIAIAGPALGALLMGSIAEWAGVPVMLTLMLCVSLVGATLLWLQRSKLPTPLNAG